MAKKRYHTVGLGGTFDHFHDGHASFINFASGFAEELIVGITDPELTKYKPYPENIQPYFKRAQFVHRFCQRNKIKHQITRLMDPFGPTINPDAKIDALAVTESTVVGGDKINEIRRSMKLRDLPIHIHKLLKDEAGETLAAFRIRAGISNRAGKVYGRIFESDLNLNPDQRDFFQKIQGEIVDEPKSITKIRVAVGDITLNKFKTNHWQFDLGIFDGHSERQKIAETSDSATAEISNPPGFITAELYKYLVKFFNQNSKKGQLLRIKGEEDLATIATVLAAPLNATIYYGQPGYGLVELPVTEELKNRFYYILSN